MLFNGFIIFSFIISAAMVYFKSLSILLMIPIWISGFILINVIFIAMLYISSLFLSDDDSKIYDYPLARKIVYLTMEWILDFSRVKFEIKGGEMIPNENFILVSNHLSRYDPIFTYVYLKDKKIAFISKKENMEIPIAGRYIRAAGFLSLDRENALRAMRTIRRAAEMMKNSGYSIGIYPEGTRNISGELLDFKEGAFVLAKKSGAPLVIAATKGTDLIKHRFPRRTDVLLDVIEVLPADRISDMNTAELANYCREKVKEAFC